MGIECSGYRGSADRGKLCPPWVLGMIGAEEQSGSKIPPLLLGTGATSPTSCRSAPHTPPSCAARTRTRGSRRSRPQPPWPCLAWSKSSPPPDLPQGRTVPIKSPLPSEHADAALQPPLAVGAMRYVGRARGGRRRREPLPGRGRARRARGRVRALGPGARRRDRARGGRRSFSTASEQRASADQRGAPVAEATYRRRGPSSSMRRSRSAATSRCRSRSRYRRPARAADAADGLGPTKIPHVARPGDRRLPRPARARGHVSSPTSGGASARAARSTPGTARPVARRRTPRGRLARGPPRASADLEPLAEQRHRTLLRRRGGRDVPRARRRLRRRSGRPTCAATPSRPPS